MITIAYNVLYGAVFNRLVFAYKLKRSAGCEKSRKNLKKSVDN